MLIRAKTVSSGASQVFFKLVLSRLEGAVVEMIFLKPSGAPELGCSECGCRWYDRLTNSCYECGQIVSEEDIAEYQATLESFYEERGIKP